MKKVVDVLVIYLCLWLTISNASFVMACTEDCEKQCNYNTIHAIGDINKSCEDTAKFFNQLAQMTGEKPYCDKQWIDQCVQDSKQSYYKDCMNGCDKCKHDKDFGCFINLPYFK